MEKLTMSSPKETAEFAKDFISKLEQNEDGATVVCLYGDLGSGKTTFTKAAASELGVQGIVTSPTFVIEKIYELEDKKFKKLFHIDAYRLKEGVELLALGWKEIVSDKNNIIIIEWPKYVADILPQRRHNLTFKFIDENTRTIETT